MSERELKAARHAWKRYRSRVEVVYVPTETTERIGRVVTERINFQFPGVRNEVLSLLMCPLALCDKVSVVTPPNFCTQDSSGFVSRLSDFAYNPVYDPIFDDAELTQSMKCLFAGTFSYELHGFNFTVSVLYYPNPELNYSGKLGDPEYHFYIGTTSFEQSETLKPTEELKEQRKLLYRAWESLHAHGPPRVIPNAVFRFNPVSKDPEFKDHIGNWDDNVSAELVGPAARDPDSRLLSADIADHGIVPKAGVHIKLSDDDQARLNQAIEDFPTPRGKAAVFLRGFSLDPAAREAIRSGEKPGQRARMPASD